MLLDEQVQMTGKSLWKCLQGLDRICRGAGDRVSAIKAFGSFIWPFSTHYLSSTGTGN